MKYFADEVVAKDGHVEFEAKFLLGEASVSFMDNQVIIDIMFAQYNESDDAGLICW